MPRRRPTPTAAVDLSSTLEALATRIGDTIGRSIAEALSQAPLPAPAPRTAAGPRRCAEAGCGRPAAAKGLCKSHYNLMLYHRRKSAAAKGAKSKTPAAKRPAAKSARAGADARKKQRPGPKARRR